MIKYILELSVFFILLPFIYFLDLIPGLWKFLPIVFFFSYCLFILFNNKELNKSDFKIRHIPVMQWLKMLIFPIVLVISLVVFTEEVFADLSDNKILLAVICYPLFSSLPQEIIYRKFFFFRYAGLFRNKKILILINAVLFSIAHLYFQNWIALLLTFLGGLAFSISYLKNRSLLFVTIEHSVYGLALLSSYMNQFFYRAF